MERVDHIPHAILTIADQRFSSARLQTAQLLLDNFKLLFIFTTKFWRMHQMQDNLSRVSPLTAFAQKPISSNPKDMKIVFFKKRKTYRYVQNALQTVLYNNCSYFIITYLLSATNAIGSECATIMCLSPETNFFVMILLTFQLIISYGDNFCLSSVLVFLY